MNYFYKNFVAVIIVFLSLLSEDSFSQVVYDINTINDQVNSILPSSPTPAAFAEYISNPVGYYTGIPQITIPIWDITLKDFHLPIYLSYHAGGIRVEEEASNVGLGWSLNAGGVITRVIKDIPDDQTPEFCEDSWYVIDGSTSAPPVDDFSYCGNGRLWAFDAMANDDFDGLNSYDIDLNSYNGDVGSANSSMNLLKQFYGVTQSQAGPYQDLYLLPVIDKEPDIFYFNFAGHTGKFVFDATSSGNIQIRIFPYQDLKIEYSTDASKKIDEFTIKDENGVLYIFNVLEQTQSYTNGYSKAAQFDNVPDSPLEVKSYESPVTKKNYTSSWFLSRIETPLGEFVDFTYEDEEYRIDKRGPQQTRDFTNPATAIGYDPNIINSSLQSHNGYYNNFVENYTTIMGKRLSKIENNNIRLDFGASHERQDLVFVGRYTPGSEPILLNAPPFAIDQITIFNKISGLTRLKKFSLNYDYFQSYTNESINPGGDFSLIQYPDTINYLDITLVDSIRYYKRLRLRSIQEFGANDSMIIPPYEFEYKDKDFDNIAWHSLPHRLSFQQDFWGYYNGAVSNNTLIPDLWVYPNNYSTKDNRQFSIFKKYQFTGPEYHLKGAIRETNLNTIDIGILTKIKYPTGGFTSYEYGSNHFLYEGNDHVGGGIRIHSIFKHAGPNPQIDYLNDIQYEYQYYMSETDVTTSGQIISLPIFAKRDKNIYVLNSPNDDSEQAYSLWTTRFSTPLAQLGRTNGSYVGYRRVKEYIEGNGSIVRKYSMPATWHIDNDISITETDGVCDPDIDGHCDGFYAMTPVVDIIVTIGGDNLNLSDYDFSQNPATENTFPFPDNPNYDWQRGHLLSEEVYDENQKLLLHKLFTYTNYFPNGNNLPKNVYGYQFEHHYPLLNNGGDPDSSYLFRAAKYKILADVTKVLDSKTEIRYDQNNPTKTATIQSNYLYESPYHAQITSSKIIDSKEQTIDNRLEYAGDFSGEEFGSDLLRENHMLNKVLRQTTYVNNNVTAKTEISYKNQNNHVVPTRYKVYKDGINEGEKMAYFYDENGNLIEKFIILNEGSDGSIINMGSPTSYIWGFGGNYPIFKIENVGYDEVLNELSTNDINILAASPTTEEIEVIHSKLYDALPSGMIYGYSYKPGIGLFSQIDPNKQETFYDYDDFGRLKLIKDNDGNIVKSYSYHYKLE